MTEGGICSACFRIPKIGNDLQSDLQWVVIGKDCNATVPYEERTMTKSTSLAGLFDAPTAVLVMFIFSLGLFSLPRPKWEASLVKAVGSRFCRFIFFLNYHGSSLGIVQSELHFVFFRLSDLFPNCEEWKATQVSTEEEITHKAARINNLALAFLDYILVCCGSSWSPNKKR